MQGSRRYIVPSSNEFWLALHNLIEAYDAEGLTADERSANIIDQFRQMPRVVQRQVLDDLRRVAQGLPDLYPVAVAVANEAELAQTPEIKAG